MPTMMPSRFVNWTTPRPLALHFSIVRLACFSSMIWAMARSQPRGAGGFKMGALGGLHCCSDAPRGPREVHGTAPPVAGPLELRHWVRSLDLDTLLYHFNL